MDFLFLEELARALRLIRSVSGLLDADNNRESRPPSSRFFRGRKTAQLRSKTASSSTILKVEVLLKGEKRLNFAPKQPLRHSTTLFSWSLRGHFAVTSQSLRGHIAVTTRSLRSQRGHYAVTTVTTRSLRSLRSQKEYIFETEKTLNFVPKRILLSYASDFINVSKWIHYTANRFQF